MEKITVKVETLSPVVLTKDSSFVVMTETNDSFSGAILRGVFAARYIALKGLGEHAHEDAGFRQAFFGGLRFVDAYPMANGKRARLLPPSLQKDKAGKSIQDLLREEGETGFKPYRGFGVIQDKKTVCPVSVYKNISLHMSRASERERLSGKSLEGNIYNYEAVAAGQCFEGAIYGDSVLLRTFLAALQLEDGSFVCYIGRSKYTQYGQCRITLQGPGALTMDLAVPSGDTLFLQLDTPLLPFDGDASDITAVLGRVAAQLGDGVELVADKIFAGATEIDNFVGVWGMKRPRQSAVSAGSVFGVRKVSGAWTLDAMAALQEILYSGIGARTEEGFGQLRVWAYQKLEPGVTVTAVAKVDTPVKVDAARELVQHIFQHRVLVQFRQYAAVDASTLKNLVDKTHLFARLEAMLGPRDEVENVKQRFTAELQASLKDGKTIKNHLQDIRLGNNSLYGWLLGHRSFPHQDEWQADLPEKASAFMQAAGVVKPSENELYYEYWHWLFRHARKQAATRSSQMTSESEGAAK